MRVSVAISLFSAFVLLPLLGGVIEAGPLDSKIEKMAERLMAGYPGESSESAALAVFPFEASKDISNTKADVAIRELLIQKILQMGQVRLVERATLDALMSEQRLGLTGAVEPETAAKIGRLIGARLVVLGSVVRVGDNYQISARLIDVETSEILGAEVAEVSAAPYTVLVFEHQRIGIYLIGQVGLVSVRDLPSVPVNGFVVTPTNHSSFHLGGGVGVRYWPSKNWLIDIGVP